MMKHSELRKHQIEAVNSIMNALKSEKRRILIGMPVGTGVMSVLMETVKRIIDTDLKGKILFLTGNMALREQAEKRLKEFTDISINFEDPSKKIILATSGRMKTQIKKLDISDLQYVICQDAQMLNVEELEPFVLIGSTALPEISKGIFKDCDFSYRYSYEDAVVEGVLMPELTPDTYPVAIEGFCRQLFELFGGEFISKDRVENKIITRNMNLSFQMKEKMIAVECKSYRDRNVAELRIQPALERIKHFRDRVNCDEYVVILFGETSGIDKKAIYDKYRITIWDVANLLYYIGDNLQLQTQLAMLVYFSLSDIVPLESVGWQPEVVGEYKNKSEMSPLEKIASLKDMLEHCPAGKKHFREYEEICESIIRELFAQEFGQMVKQKTTSDKLFRMDVICTIKSSSSFWALIRQHYNSHFVIFEYKNYASTLEQNLIYTTEKYLFNTGLRNVAIILSRKGFSKNAQMAANGCLRESGKLILNINDEDLHIMLKQKAEGLNPSDYLVEKLEGILMGINK